MFGAGAGVGDGQFTRPGLQFGRVADAIGQAVDGVGAGLHADAEGLAHQRHVAQGHAQRVLRPVDDRAVLDVAVGVVGPVLVQRESAGLDVGALDAQRQQGLNDVGGDLVAAVEGGQHVLVAGLHAEAHQRHVGRAAGAAAAGDGQGAPGLLRLRGRDEGQQQG